MRVVQLSVIELLGKEDNMQEEIIIKCKQASVTLGRFRMQPINMEIPQGYIIGVTGKNGSGKSTFMKMLLGRYPKMNGSIEIAGLDVIKQREAMLCEVGYISEEREFFVEKNAGEHEAIYAKYYPNWNHQLFEDLLRRYEVSMYAKYGALSKGNQIKFQQAFATACMPKVIVMDEPTAGLDPVFRIDFMKWMQDLVAEYNTTILISSHIREELEQVADYMIRVESGVCTYEEVLR